MDDLPTHLEAEDVEGGDGDAENGEENQLESLGRNW